MDGEERGDRFHVLRVRESARFDRPHALMREHLPRLREHERRGHGMYGTHARSRLHGESRRDSAAERPREMERAKVGGEPCPASRIETADTEGTRKQDCDVLRHRRSLPRTDGQHVTS